MNDEKRQKALAHMRRQYSKTATLAAEHGWEIKHLLEDDLGEPRLDVTVTRGTEKITIWWQGGKLLVAPEYEFAGMTTKLRNHSAMLKQMASKPDPKAVKRRTDRASRRGGERYDLVEVIRDLPWDPDELEDRDILAGCYGKSLVWRNSITGEVEQDWVKADSENPQSGPNWNKTNYKIKRSSAGRRIIHFVGATGYRAVGLDALLRVG